MRTLIDFDSALAFAIPTVNRSGGTGIREGMLLEGPQGWGEFSPFADDDVAAWLTAATEPGTVGWPDTTRGRIPISVTVPAVDPAAAHQLVAGSGCGTADVVVAERPDSLADDIARLNAVRDALGAQGAIRCIANGAWDVDTGVQAIGAIVRAVGDLEYVQDPCRTLAESATLRSKLDVRIAADVASHPADEAPARLIDAADVAVLRTGPLGGVRRALRVGERIGLPCVVSSTLETSIGLAAGLAVAGALPELPFACALGTRLLMSGDVVSAARSLVPVDGCLPVAPMSPAPDDELVARYALTDPNRLAWWRKRLRANLVTGE
jgi:O-succinylbenzoate synthase